MSIRYPVYLGFGRRRDIFASLADHFDCNDSSCVWVLLVFGGGKGVSVSYLNKKELRL